MIINNPDALKGWLTIILEPLCDADPCALARYVFALLKKDKPVKELKKSMTEQLHVFLGVETKPFLERLFNAIASEEYLGQPVATTVATAVADDVEIANNLKPDSDIALVKHDRECTPPLNDSKTKDFLSVKEENGTPSSGQSQTPNTVVISPLSTTQSLSPAKAASDKENQPRESRRRRASLRSRSRTRSRSPDRARRSRSRERRLNEREKSSRQFRNKSPPSDRRRSENRRVPERSPRAVGKSRTKSHSASRSRSASPERRKISRSTSPSANDNISGSKRQRCRDFDEKGYCVRGETCPWDHGVNPVVLEGLNNPALITMPPHLREYNPDAPELWNRGGNFTGPRGAFPHNKTGSVPGTYARPPGVGFRAVGPPFSFPVNPAATTPLQRELISVPVVDANSGGDVSTAQTKRRYEPEDTVAIAEGPTKRKLPINSRLGPRVGPQQNCSLELRKIPRGMNTIAHLNNHFSKFGKIINIQISYDGDPEAAIVTFSTHAEANVAYRSTEAVLNNRFIKVFWHSPGGVGETTLTSGVKDDTITNGRKLSQYHLNNIVPAVPNPAAEGAKTTVMATQSTASTSVANNASSVTTVAAAHLQAPSSLRVKNNRHMPSATNAIIRKKQEEHVKAAVQLAHGLHKRKHELLQEYLKQMKQAVELVERVDHTDPQRAKMLDTIKELQGSIDRLRKEISQEQAQIAAQIQNQPPVKKSKEQQKKELLDIELELIAQQQEGNDTTAIQKRLEDLQRSLGISNKSHFSGKNNRIRAVPPGSTCVDRRPRTLLISGFSSEESDLLLGHFKHFGEITKHEIDRSIPQLTISYATRANAEQAALRGKLFKDKRLTISWAPAQNPSPPQKMVTDNNNTSVEKPIEKMESDILPELRLEDEEEEEDGETEHRSWRR